MARLTAAYLSPAARSARLTAAVLDLACRLADEWNGAHPDECDCPFCEHDTEAQGVTESMFGIAYGVRPLASALRCGLAGGGWRPGDLPVGDILRSLADQADGTRSGPRVTITGAAAEALAEIASPSVYAAALSPDDVLAALMPALTAVELGQVGQSQARIARLAAQDFAPVPASALRADLLNVLAEAAASALAKAAASEVARIDNSGGAAVPDAVVGR